MNVGDTLPALARWTCWGAVRRPNLLNDRWQIAHTVNGHGGRAVKIIDHHPGDPGPNVAHVRFGSPASAAAWLERTLGIRALLGPAPEVDVDVRAICRFFDDAYNALLPPLSRPAGTLR